MCPKSQRLAALNLEPRRHQISLLQKHPSGSACSYPPTLEEKVFDQIILDNLKKLSEAALTLWNEADVAAAEECVMEEVPTWKSGKAAYNMHLAAKELTDQNHAVLAESVRASKAAPMR